MGSAARTALANRGLVLNQIAEQVANVVVAVARSSASPASPIAPVAVSRKQIRIRKGSESLPHASSNFAFSWVRYVYHWEGKAILRR
jgi:hypothetical protein